MFTNSFRQQDKPHWLSRALFLAALGLISPRWMVGAPQNPPPASALISELRTWGPNGGSDWFVELFNAQSRPISLSGWSLRFRDESGAEQRIDLGSARIEARSHRLLVGKTYSLSKLATGDVISAANICGGVQLCDASGQIVDAVGPENSETAWSEGEALPAFYFAREAQNTKKSAPQLLGQPTETAPRKAALLPIPQFSLVRRARDGQPQDSSDNAADFVLVSVTAQLDEHQTALGAPGPENAASPPLRPRAAPENAPFDLPDSAPIRFQNAALQADSARTSIRRARRERGPLKTFGTLTLRYRFLNDTAFPLQKLWFRVNEISCEPDSAAAPEGSADVRFLRGKAPQKARLGAKTPQKPPLLSAKIMAKQRTIGVWKAKLLGAPSQPLGGGLNALLPVELPSGGIAPGARGEIWFALGVERPGHFRVVLGNRDRNLVFEGDTEADTASNLENLTGQGSVASKILDGFARAPIRNSGGAANLSNRDQNDAGPAAIGAIGAAAGKIGGLLLEGNTEEGVPRPARPSTRSS